MIDYQPRGRTGYLCTLASPGGFVLVVEGDTDGTAEVSGDLRLLENDALTNSLTAYALHEHQYRRLRAAEKREGHQKEAQRQEKRCLALAHMIDDLGDRRRRGWCSACLQRTSHRAVRGMTLPAPTYLCVKCGGPTTPCAVPGCQHMANRGFGRALSARYCAPHRHEIPSFEKLEDQLKSIEDYASWLDFDARNAARITKIAALTVVGGAVLAPAALVAAPAIGGAVGSLSGLSGAAATSHGLALLGGGAIAAGGYGMAGGTAVVTAAGAALGGVRGAAITSAYVSTDSSFRIEKLRDGDGPAVLFATGFLTEGDDGWAGWDRLIDTRYPEAPVYRIHWGAKEVRALALVLGIETGRRVARSAVIKAAKRATKQAGNLVGPLAALLGASGIAKNPWTVARTRADMTGAVIADLVARIRDEQFILVGHSLGGRVMIRAAQALGTKRLAEPRIVAVHVLGAAVGRKDDWLRLNEAVAERVWNYHSSHDAVLARLYRTAEFGQKAVGRVGFRSRYPNISDRDVSRRVSSHTKYVANVELASPRTSRQ